MARKGIYINQTQDKRLSFQILGGNVENTGKVTNCVAKSGVVSSDVVKSEIDVVRSVTETYSFYGKELYAILPALDRWIFAGVNISLSQFNKDEL